MRDYNELDDNELDLDLDEKDTDLDKVSKQTPHRNKKKGKTISRKRELLNTGIYLLIVLVLTYLFIVFVCQKTEVIGSSMYPTLENGDQLLVDKISYRFGDPQRFDIVVFPPKYEENTFYIKRIIGLPGETVEVKNVPTTIEGNSGMVEWKLVISIKKADSQEETFEVLEDKYGYYSDLERVLPEGQDYIVVEGDETTAPVVLGENEYFVMGDNRDNSKDSRNPMVGKIKRKDIIGKAFFRIWPFSGFGFIPDDGNQGKSVIAN